MTAGAERETIMKRETGEPLALILFALMLFGSAALVVVGRALGW